MRAVTDATKKRALPGRLAAGVLAALTLGAFYILQDYGPVSAVRRFHTALARKDLAAIQQVVEEPVKDESVQYLFSELAPKLQEGVQPQLARTDRQGDQDDVVVVYNLPEGSALAIVWIVDRRGSLWKINARLTAEALYRSVHS